MNTKDLHKLEKRIEYLREQLNSLGKVKGLNHTKTLKYSQELDDCLNTYHHHVNAKPK